MKTSVSAKCRPFCSGLHVSTHWGRDKMADIFRTTFSNAFSWMKIFEFKKKSSFHWKLFLAVQLTIFQHGFRQWLGAGQTTSHCLNQWWLVYWRIYASLGLNELMILDSPRQVLSTIVYPMKHAQVWSVALIVTHNCSQSWESQAAGRQNDIIHVCMYDNITTGHRQNLTQQQQRPGDHWKPGLVMMPNSLFLRQPPVLLAMTNLALLQLTSFRWYSLHGPWTDVKLASDSVAWYSRIWGCRFCCQLHVVPMWYDVISETVEDRMGRNCATF